MRAYVFTDPSLKRHAGRFVWLSIDAEKKVNASFRTRYPMPALPSYYVVDPNTGKVTVRAVGGMTVQQLHRFLDGAVATWARGAGGSPADVALARADSLYGAGEDSLAAAGYRAALAQAPSDWSSYLRAIDALLFALSNSGQESSILEVANGALPRVRRTPTWASVAGSGLGAAVALPESLPGRAGAITTYEHEVYEVLADTTLGLTGDDVSGLYISLLDAKQSLGDSVAARATAEAWSAHLDRAAARGRNAQERAVYDSHRLSAYLELGQPERAVPMLQAAERELPDDYNPPARLATAYRAMKQWDAAIAASDRALAKAYGPRRFLLWRTRVGILTDKGDAAAARTALESAISEAEGMPEGQRSQRTIDGFKKQLAELAK
jgi:tetratricopeptide (TPR) repeat protein